MQPVDAKIDDLRRQIDEIDARMHDLAMQRSDVAAEIGALKAHNDGNGLRFRPGREAVILRRLVARHRGRLPAAAIVRMWRELMAALLRLQAPFSVAVFSPPEAPGYWDLARDHFGSLTPAVPHGSAGQVLGTVLAGQAAVGVLPMPQENEPEPWWPLLMGKDSLKPRIIARLPFGAAGSQRGGAVEAVVIGRGALEDTGDDRSLFVIESADDVSRGGMMAALVDVGLTPGAIHARRRVADGATWLHLVEAEGCVQANDARLAQLMKSDGIGARGVWPLGGYAVPLSPSQLGGA